MCVESVRTVARHFSHLKMNRLEIGRKIRLN